jgi:hypothetical protein
LQEFGNDLQSILLIFLIFNLYFELLKKNSYDDILIKKILLYSTFATLFKIHGILINLLLLIFIFEIKNFIKKDYFKIYAFILISYLCTFSTSFINSGCFLFPFESTCYGSNKISWSSKENLKNTNLEAYNKGYEKYSQKNNSNAMTMDEWVNDFNWASFHFTSKNFYKPFIKSIFILFFIFFIFLKFCNYKIHKPKPKEIFFLFISVSIIIIWLIKIPLMRASGYGYVVCFLIFLFCTFINVINLKNLKKLNYILLLVIIVPLLFLNINRIYKEQKKYETNNTFFFLEMYGKNGTHSKYKTFNSFITSSKIEKKFNYFILKNF